MKLGTAEIFLELCCKEKAESGRVKKIHKNEMHSASLCNLLLKDKIQKKIPSFGTKGKTNYQLRSNKEL